MLIKKRGECPELRAMDGCRLRELLHPKNDPIEQSFSLAWARLEPGESSRPHRLLRQTEVYHVLAGTGRMHIAGETGMIGPGDSVHIPAGAEQWVENTGACALEFLAIVGPPWRAEDDRLVEE